MKKQYNKYTISFVCSPEMLNAIDEKRNPFGLSRSEVLRKILSDALVKNGGLE